MTAASSGRRREWLVRDAFVQKGCELVARSAGSLGPADIIACDDKRLYLVAVRTNRWPPPAVRTRLAKLKVPPGTLKLAAKVTRRSVSFMNIDLEVETGAPIRNLGRLITILGPFMDRKLETHDRWCPYRKRLELSFALGQLSGALEVTPTRTEKG